MRIRKPLNVTGKRCNSSSATVSGQGCVDVDERNILAASCRVLRARPLEGIAELDMAPMSSPEVNTTQDVHT